LGHDAVVPQGDDQLPILVMVSGAPGSGKSKLARLLGEELDVPWLSRDPISRGMRMTEGVMPPPSRSWAVWYSTLAYLLSNSVSLVMDQTMYRGIAEPDIQAHLLGLCNAKLVHCHASNAFERFKAREIDRHGQASSEYERVLAAALQSQELTAEPPDLGIDLLRVDTSDGYRPSLDGILEFVLRALRSRR
jgi:predicted kinase